MKRSTLKKKLRKPNKPRKQKPSFLLQPRRKRKPRKIKPNCYPTKFWPNKRRKLNKNKRKKLIPRKRKNRSN